MLLIGKGGHAKSVGEVAASTGERALENLSIEEFLERFHDCDSCPSQPVLFAVGSVARRFDLASRCREREIEFAVLVSPAAYLAPDSEVGNGTVVMPNAALRTAARVGQHCIINTGCVVDHDVRVGDFVNLGPGAILCGRCRLGSRVVVGAGATVIDGISVCEGAIIGAGATVIRDIVEEGTYMGTPAKRRGQ